MSLHAGQGTVSLTVSVIRHGLACPIILKCPRRLHWQGGCQASGSGTPQAGPRCGGHAAHFCPGARRGRGAGQLWRVWRQTAAVHPGDCAVCMWGNSAGLRTVQRPDLREVADRTPLISLHIVMICMRPMPPSVQDVTLVAARERLKLPPFAAAVCDVLHASAEALEQLQSLPSEEVRDVLYTICEMRSCPKHWLATICPRWIARWHNRQGQRVHIVQTMPYDWEVSMP
jgi:hypothetical protein